MIIESILEKHAAKKTGAHPSSPAYWIQKLLTGAGGSTAAGIDMSEDMALTMSAVWNAVNIVAGAVGFLPLVVYERLADSGRERAHTARQYQLLHDRPNPFMDALSFRETLTSHALLWGNGYAEIERDGAQRAIALWPLLPNRMRLDVKERQLLYLYTSNDGFEHRLGPDSVFHIKGLGFDGLKGYSVIHYAAEGLAAGLAAERFGSAFFGNGAWPGGAIKHPSKLSDTARTNLRNSIETMHKGLDQAHRIAILEEGMSWEQIGIPARDAQLLQTRQYSVSDVARWFDIPPHMLKDLTRSTYSNIEHQGIEFVTWTLAKWLMRWQHEANWKLFSDEERPRFYAEFLTDALLRGDTQSRYAAYSAAINAGWLKPNEVRLRENLNPDPSIEGFRQPVNIVTVGTGAEKQPTTPKIVQPKDGMTDAQRAAFHHLICETWRRIVTKEVRAIRKTLKSPGDLNAHIEEFYAKHRTYASQVLDPVLRACFGIGMDASAHAQSYAAEGMAALKKRLVESNGGAAGALDALLDEWEADKTEQLATSTMLAFRR